MISDLFHIKIARLPGNINISTCAKNTLFQCVKAVREFFSAKNVNNYIFGIKCSSSLILQYLCDKVLFNVLYIALDNLSETENTLSCAEFGVFI